MQRRRHKRIHQRGNPQGVFTPQKNMAMLGLKNETARLISLCKRSFRLLNANSSKITLKNVTTFKIRLKSRGYPNHLIEKTISHVDFTKRQSALEPKLRVNKGIPSVRN